MSNDCSKVAPMQSKCENMIWSSFNHSIMWPSLVSDVQNPESLKFKILSFRTLFMPRLRRWKMGQQKRRRKRNDETLFWSAICHKARQDITYPCMLSSPKPPNGMLPLKQLVLVVSILAKEDVVYSRSRSGSGSSTRMTASTCTSTEEQYEQYE